MCIVTDMNAETLAITIILKFNAKMDKIEAVAAPNRDNWAHENVHFDRKN